MRRVQELFFLIAGILGALAFGSFVYYESHVYETPFTKRKRFLAFNDEQFNEMSKYELELVREICYNCCIIEMDRVKI